MSAPTLHHLLKTKKKLLRQPLSKGLGHSRFLLGLEILFANRILLGLDIFLKNHSSRTSFLQYLFDAGVIRDLDGHLRYKAVKQIVGLINQGFVLDVGGGEGQHFSDFFGTEHAETVALNLRASSLVDLRNRAKHNVLGDGCNLPFRDNSFFIAMSLEVLHQIPRSMRKRMFSEMQRVSNLVVLQDGIISKADYERINYWQTVMVKGKLPHTYAESSSSLMGDLTGNLEDIQITGNRNFSMWIWSTWLLGKTPAIRLTVVLLYYSILRHFDRNPPYHGIIVTWHKKVG